MRRLFVIAIALTIGLPMVAVLLLVAAAGSQAQCGGGGPAGPGSAPRIPASLLGIYDQAAGAYQLGPQGWAYLAAINYVETSFGQDLSPSSQGAIGWMQFEPGTWAQYAVSADPTSPAPHPTPTTLGTRSSPPPTTCTPTARRATGRGRSTPTTTPAGTSSEVQQLAQRYTQTAGSAVAIDASHAAPQAGCVAVGPTTPGSAARILPDGLAAAPQDAPAPVKAAIAAGNRIIDTSYSTEREPNMLTHRDVLL